MATYWAQLAGGAAILFLLTSGVGADDSRLDRLERFLAHGEFAPALRLAQETEDPSQRDLLISRVAMAQARSGALDAALYSTSRMGSDRGRSASLSALRSEPMGGRGGGAQADFDSLIDLITSTIAPDSWEDVGGEGTIREFAGGVDVDGSGLLRPRVIKDTTGLLDGLAHAAAVERPAGDVRTSSPLRKISLTRLERAVQLAWAAGREPTEAMRTLAGLKRIRYVFFYPKSGDIVLAGPAGEVATDREGRLVSRDDGRPVIRLDDLVVVLRHMLSGEDARFGCSITPTPAGLERIQTQLQQSASRPLKPRERSTWLATLRDSLGKQEIEVWGLDPSTHAARVIVEADYRMKLVGMGLEEGVLGVTSYLDLIQIPPGEKTPPPMDVLRWWFTLNYQAVVASGGFDAFEIRGQAVQVQSENEWLAAGGKRVQTGKSEPLNLQFAASFTTHYGALCQKYPIYAELQNVFDLALVGALLRSERLPATANWHLTWFGEEAGYEADRDTAPQWVESVINHRVIGNKHVIAGVSGGVIVDPNRLVDRGAYARDGREKLGTVRESAAPPELPIEQWWWD